MRLAAVSMVRNEADIIEAFVRHNLTVIDHLVVIDHLAVIDHGSFDGTSAIPAALVAEGLPITVATNDSVGLHQADLHPPQSARCARHILTFAQRLAGG